MAVVEKFVIEVSKAWVQRHVARAAIEAMKNPSEAVTFAAFEFLDGPYSHERITLAWNAGIDAALTAFDAGASEEF